jgi:hypothetical protein
MGVLIECVMVSDQSAKNIGTLWGVLAESVLRYKGQKRAKTNIRPRRNAEERLDQVPLLGALRRTGSRRV